MRIMTKGLLGAFAAISVTATTPLYAGITAAPAKSEGFYKLEQESGFHKRNKRHRHYADQRVGSNTRIWRGDDGRYRCKKDNGTTGLLIGGAVGGLAGHEIAGNGDKLLGTVLGAAGGALQGREIDRDKYRCR